MKTLTELSGSLVRMAAAAVAEVRRSLPKEEEKPFTPAVVVPASAEPVEAPATEAAPEAETAPLADPLEAAPPAEEGAEAIAPGETAEAAAIAPAAPAKKSEVETESETVKALLDDAVAKATGCTGDRLGMLRAAVTIVGRRTGDVRLVRVFGVEEPLRGAQPMTTKSWSNMGSRLSGEPSGGTNHIASRGPLRRAPSIAHYPACGRGNPPRKSRRLHMTRTQLTRSLAVLSLALATSALAADFGTAAEAKAMLEKAVVALQANQATALSMFTKGEGGFKDRDLYPFCGGPDGMFTAHPTLVGKSLKDLKDKSGKPLGEENLQDRAAGEDRRGLLHVASPRHADPVQKVSYVTKVGDQVCAVGYYK